MSRDEQTNLRSNIPSRILEAQQIPQEHGIVRGAHLAVQFNGIAYVRHFVCPSRYILIEYFEGPRVDKNWHVRSERVAERRDVWVRLGLLHAGAVNLSTPTQKRRGKPISAEIRILSNVEIIGRRPKNIAGVSERLHSEGTERSIRR